MKNIMTVIILALFVIPITVIIMSFGRQDDAAIEEKTHSFFENEVTEQHPHAKADGTPYRICYVDIDPYPPSGEMLYYLLQEMNDMGWMDVGDFSKVPFDPQDTDAGALIDYLAQNGVGDYISFSEKYNYYIALDDVEQVKQEISEGIEAGEIDLILCLGTSPGKLVINEMGVTDVPVMVYYSVDPVSAGMSADQEYSGRENVWCHTSLEVYKNQLNFYYDAYPFTKIGMVYYDESIAAMETYRSAAASLGVEIVEKKVTTLSSGIGEETYYRSLRQNYEDLVAQEGIDAFLLNTDMIKDPGRMEELLSVFNDAGIPVFVQNGQSFVQNGALMLMAASDAASQAPFAADAFARILNGEKPGNIYQKYVPSPYISINLDTAERIGYEIPDEILLSSEKIFGGGEAEH